MTAISVISSINLTDSPFRPSYNTGTPLDLATGSMQPGFDGSYIMSGGLWLTNGVVGRPNLFKSTLLFSAAMNALVRYPHSELIVRDSEYAQEKRRLLQMPNLDPIAETGDKRPLEERVVIHTPLEGDLERFLQEVVRPIYESKLARIKDYMVETPFYDPATGKNLRVLIPTFIGWDSFSKDSAEAVDDILVKNKASSSDTNMVYMKDGNIKTKIMRQLGYMAAKAGLVFLQAGHIGDKFELDPYAPKTKVLQHMRANDKIKGMGQDFAFLVGTLLQPYAAKVELDNKKEPWYPDPAYAAEDIMWVESMITRCKGNMSGTKITSLISQKRGYLPALTMYDYLRECDYFGLVGNNTQHRPALLPDRVLMRTKAVEKLQDRKTARAIEILYQIAYIKNNWTTAGLPVSFDVSIEKLTETLLTKATYAIDDILESRGWWTYDTSNQRPYLSVFDVLGIVEGSYKPKFLKAAAVAKAS